jgi:hypothetical protein
MTVPTYINTGAIGYDTSGAASVTPAVPTHQTNDILIATAWNENAVMSTSTSGWTLLGSASVAGTADEVAYWWKRATSSGTSGPTITAADTDLFAVVSVYRGCITTGTPFESATVIAQNTDDSENEEVYSSTITSTLTDSLLLILGVIGDVPAWNSSPPPTGWTLDDNSSTTLGTDAEFFLMSKAAASTTTITGFAVARHDSDLVGESWGTASLALISADGTPPIYTTSRTGDNTTSTTIGVDMPAYVAGDLITVAIDYWQDNNTTNDITWPSGPEGETITSVTTRYGGAGGLNLDLPLTALGYFIGTGSHTASTWNVTADLGTRYGAATIKVLDGEFNTDQPLSTAMGSDYDTTDTTAPTVPSFTSTSKDENGFIFNFIGADQDPYTGIPSGYTSLEQEDYGRASMVLAIRDDLSEASETISASVYTIAGDAWTAYGFIVQRPFDGFNMKVNIGDSWKEVVSIKINIGDTWKDVTAVKQNISDSWRDV